jgi:putative spermidine/putrescine transport system permease protein
MTTVAGAMNVNLQQPDRRAESGGRRRVTSRRPMLTAVLPASVYVVLLLFVPFVVLVYLSLHRNDSSTGYRDVFTFDQYIALVRSPVYFDSLVGTGEFGLAVTLLCAVLGYPIAYYIARSGSRYVSLITAVVVLPLFVSVVVRTFGWMVLLGREGTINSLFAALGLTSVPLPLLYTRGAVILGLIHISIPLMVLPIASVLRGIDRSLDDAARSLGASNARAFWTIVVPLSLPGVAAGCILVFSQVIAAFVLPALLGSERIKLMATMIYQQVLVIGNVPLGAALAVVMVAASFVVICLVRLVSRRFGT